MKYFWQPQVLALVLGLLSATTSPAVASSFVLQTTSLTPFVKGGRNLTLLRGGSDDLAAPLEGEQEGVPPVVSTTSLLGPNAKTPPGFLRSKLPGFPWHRLPDWLTYARCLAIPAFVALFYADMKGKSHLYTGTIFALASITDWFDGFLARRWDISTAFGAFLDPVADKLMVSTSLVLLAGKYGSIAAIPSLIILAREIAVSALREWMAQRGERDTVKVGYQGKVKTALTMMSLTILLYTPSTSSILYKVGIPLLYMSSVITITSGSVYFMAAAPALLGTKE